MIASEVETLRVGLQVAARRVAELEGELQQARAELVDARAPDAAQEALDEIAKLCGCPSWDYPDQITRDVAAVVGSLEITRVDLQQARERIAALVTVVEVAKTYERSHWFHGGPEGDVCSVCLHIRENGRCCSGDCELRPLREVLDALAAPTPAEPIVCRQCGKPVEDARRCYATPICYACLPPPKPLEFGKPPRGEVG